MRNRRGGQLAADGQVKMGRNYKYEVDQMLRNLGERVLQSLGNMDRAYADKLYEMQGRDKGNAFIGMTSTAPIKDLLEQDMGGNRAGQFQKYGLIGSNLASRYALPAGTAVALQQAIANLYGQASDMPIYPSDEA